MDTKWTRTTISLPEELLFEIKKKALMEKKTVKEVISTGLSIYLGYGDETVTDINSLFGAWGKGERGISFVKRVRNGREEKNREKYINSLWKRSL